MTINIPTLSEIQQRIRSDLILSVNSGQTDLSKQIDPTIRNSLIGGLVDAISAGFDENNDVIKQLLLQIFPQTATDEYLEFWATLFGITRKSATKSSGKILFQGTASTTIPANTGLNKSDNLSYNTISSVTISNQILSIASITRIGSTATATTSSPHGLATGLIISITGATQTEYNITNQAIAVTGLNTFTFTVSGTPTTPATGTISLNSDFAIAQVIAEDYGSLSNSGSGTVLNLISPIAGVNDTAFVDFEGLSGGLDLEDDEELRSRLLERLANFSAPFSSGGLPIFIKERVAGVTRIWIQDATPSAGYVTIYFVRDEDNIIPTGDQILDVKNAIIDPVNGIKPANTPDSYVIVNAPTALPVNFTISSLSPNTNDMKNAITASLTDYFKSPAVVLGEAISLTKLNNIIFSSVDSAGNNPSFTLSAPVSGITPTSSQLPVLGTITFS